MGKKKPVSVSFTLSSISIEPWRWDAWGCHMLPLSQPEDSHGRKLWKRRKLIIENDRLADLGIEEHVQEGLSRHHGRQEAASLQLGEGESEKAEESPPKKGRKSFRTHGGRVGHLEMQRKVGETWRRSWSGLCFRSGEQKMPPKSEPGEDRPSGVQRVKRKRPSWSNLAVETWAQQIASRLDGRREPLERF